MADVKLEKVFHASPLQGLDKITPNKSSHGEEWVYATKDQDMCAVFLGRLGGDFTCSVGRDKESGLPYIVERFEGAFKKRFGSSGSIYVLPSDGFKEKQTHWGEEVVTNDSVVPVTEITIDSVKDYLLQLASEGRLIIKLYPDRFAFIPGDDSDLIEKAMNASKEIGELPNSFKQFHPHLVNKVMKKSEDQD